LSEHRIAEEPSVLSAQTMQRRINQSPMNLKIIEEFYKAGYATKTKTCNCAKVV